MILIIILNVYHQNYHRLLTLVLDFFEHLKKKKNFVLHYFLYDEKRYDFYAIAYLVCLFYAFDLISFLISAFTCI